MRRLRNHESRPGGVLGWLALGVVAWLGCGTAAWAQPANDNFANAQEITGFWGVFTNDNTLATAEVNEPSHAGFTATASLWYKWTAVDDGVVTVDTFGSLDASGLALDTAVAVYDGSQLMSLRQVAANDDMYPFAQTNDSSFGLILSTRFYGSPFLATSVTRFNAKAGETYFIAVDSKFGLTGQVVLSLACNSAGVFRFATEDIDFLTGSLLYQCSAEESMYDMNSTTETYYRYSPPGVLVTITRVAGSSGRMIVEYTTQDDTAFAGVDYTPVFGKLVFDDFEMSKTIVVPVSSFQMMNVDFVVAITNVYMDTLEDSVRVSPPRLDPLHSFAVVRILSPYLEGNDQDQFPNQDGNPPTHDIYNFLKVHYRVPEDVNSYFTEVNIRVYKTMDISPDADDSATLHYRINNFLGAGQDTSEERNNWFPLQPGSDYATPTPTNAAGHAKGMYSDYVLTEGTITVPDNVGYADISFTVTNDTLTEFNEDFHITLWRDNEGPRVVGQINECVVTILYDDQDPPAGSVDQYFNPDYAKDMVPSVITPRELAHPGADGVVYSLVTQADGKTIIGGDFLNCNNSIPPLRRIARLDLSGLPDAAFNPGAGANGFIGAVALAANNQIVIGGGFSSYNGTSRSRLARLNSNGSLDMSFSPVVNGPVWALQVQPDNKVVLAGDFTAINGEMRMHVARLNADGSLDAAFNPGFDAPDGVVWALALQTDGKIVLGGEFLSMGGSLFQGVARLNADGTLDTTFNPGTGVDGVVYALALQTSGKMLIGGEFRSVDSHPANRLARLNTDGSFDATLNSGTGANDTVYTLASQADGTVYIGGIFRMVNGTHRRGFARLYADGTVDTTFMDMAYNQFAGLHRGRFSDPAGIVYTSTVQPDGKVLIGGSFSQVGGGQASEKVRFEAAYPTNLYNGNLWTEPKSRAGLRNRNNLARLMGGATPGPGNISLMVEDYLVGEDQGSMDVALVRQNGSLGYLAATVSVEPGLIQSGLLNDYVYNGIQPIYLSSWNLEFYGAFPSEPASSTRMHSDGVFGPNSVVSDIFGVNWFQHTPPWCTLTINDDSSSQGDRSSSLQLANPSGQDSFFLGGENIPLGGALGRSAASLTIVDDDFETGEVGFSAATYSVSEGVGTATINVWLSVPPANRVIVYCSAVPGTATPGSGGDYSASTKQLIFNRGQTNQTYTLQISDDSQVEDDETITLNLSSLTGEAVLGRDTAVLTIVDNDVQAGRLNFTSANYATNEAAPVAWLSVKRTGGSAGIVSVQYSTADDTATAGADYVATNGLLTWNSGDVAAKTIAVPLIRDGLIEADERVSVRIFGATSNGIPNAMVLGSVSNATLTINNADFRGTVRFTSDQYSINENGGVATIPVVRVGGSAESLSVTFSAYGFTAVPPYDFAATNMTLSFGPGELSKSVNIAIVDNAFKEGNRQIALALSNAVPASALGSPSAGLVTIVDDESSNEPAGSLDTLYTAEGMNDAVNALALQTDGSLIAGGDFTVVNNVIRNHIARLDKLSGALDTTFSSSINGPVRALVSQSDDRVVVGGTFTQVNGVARPRLARLNVDGSVDTAFNVGSGADNPVFALAEDLTSGSRKLVVGGSFTKLGTGVRIGVGRLNDDGTVDASFDPLSGPNAAVYAVAVYSTNSPHAGKVLIGGDFDAVDGLARGRIARLNLDGTVDGTFDPGVGASGSVRAIAIQLDGRILIGGVFTNVQGVAMNHIARLNDAGKLDASFKPGVGANDTVLAIAIQPDTRIVLGGLFTRCNDVSRGRVTRLYSDGTVDTTINFGAGANGFVSACVVQPDGKIILGGGFTEYDGTARQRLARIYGGSIAGSGTFEYTATSYTADENGTNATVTVRRRGGTSAPAGGTNVLVNAVTSDGTATNGVHYVGGTHVLTFPPGEVFQSFLVTLLDDFEINVARTVNLALGGGIPTATLTIENDDSAVSFEKPAFTEGEAVVTAHASIKVVRSGSLSGTVTVDFTTTTNGTATAGVDFMAVTNTLTFASGVSTQMVTIPIINDTLIEENETVGLKLTNVIGALLLNPSEAMLTIVNDDLGPGEIRFADLTYLVGEGAGTAAIRLVRTNGQSGEVSVGFFTAGGTALPAADYTYTADRVTFPDGVTTQTIYVPVLNDALVEGTETFTVTLTNVSGGAVLTGNTTAPVAILDDEVGFSFSAPAYLAQESGGNASITVLRLGGTNGTVSVRYSATNGTAILGQDFGAPAGTGLLTFSSGETLKTFTVPVYQDSVVEGDETFTLLLSDASAGAQLLNATASVSILDDDSGLGFALPAYTVHETTNVTLTVTRVGGRSGTVTVSYGVADGSAINGEDFVVVGGQLVFTNDEAVKTITVPIINDTTVETNETFSVFLSAPSGSAVLTDTNVTTVTIVDNDSGLAFSSPSYFLSEAGVRATVTVSRSGILTNVVGVSYVTEEGSASNGHDYTNVSGVLVFTNGVTSRTLTIPVYDDTVEESPETVNLRLFAPTGQVSVVEPGAAVLTILDNDGGAIRPAGAKLMTESGPANGAIDPGETVSILFALRNISGADTANLVATLVATNGVTAPSAAQTYGALANRGASVSREFSFTGSGTNGSIISATFDVRDGATNYGLVAFQFLLGSTSAGFTNNAAIEIRDYTNAAPYPAVITVTNLVGSVSKVAVTLTNLAHINPDDIDMLLVGPRGQKAMLMSDVGGTFSITNVTLTLDDTATNALPDSTRITSGTARPTDFLSDTVFASPAPAGPYLASLAVFNGTNPNGEWSLFIQDDTQGDSGSVQRGWSLAITTSGQLLAEADMSVTVNESSDPTIITSNLTYTVVVTNHGPWAVTGVVVTNVLPASATLFEVGMPSTGSTSTNGGEIRWSIGSMAKDAVATLTITARPMSKGSITNVCTVSANESDPNSDNSKATTRTLVVDRTADVGITIYDAPDPAMLGDSLTYTLVVTNGGPVTAPGVTVTNTLPAGVSFVSASPAYSLVGNKVVFPNLGDLPVGQQLFATVVVRLDAAGTLTDRADCGSQLIGDPKGNNSMEVKTVVIGAQLSFSVSGSSLSLFWPADATGYELARATNLVPPVIWLPVTQTPVVTNGQNTVTITIGSGDEFFKLQSSTP